MQKASVQTGLKAVFVNCTLKSSPQRSHTERHAGCRFDHPNWEYR